MYDYKNTMSSLSSVAATSQNRVSKPVLPAADRASSSNPQAGKSSLQFPIQESAVAPPSSSPCFFSSNHCMPLDDDHENNLVLKTIWCNGWRLIKCSWVLDFSKLISKCVTRKDQMTNSRERCFSLSGAQES